MNTFELKIWDNEGKSCTFYTVQWQDEEENETDKFFHKYEYDATYRDSVQQLLSFVLFGIGEDNGAVDILFNRFENEVTGLPVQGKIRLGELLYHYPNFPLRLYALKITEQIVVLFNGGIKDGPTNQTSSLHFQWKEACAFAKRIIEAISNEDILIDKRNRKLTNYMGDDELIL